ncbi:MAG: histidine phosphatase family protein [Bacteroidetes bacterium]|nr:histidine phosphatase family protein [Bacteroidota bacterium]
MKTLYIVRHAKSSWDHAGLTDFERPLNTRGQHDAPMMGTVLKDLGARPELIRCSAANRALTTARFLAESLAYPPESIDIDASLYGAGPLEILSVVHNLPEDVQEVMLVGHNPTMHMVANRMGGFQADNLPTCGIVCIDFNVESWEEVTVSPGTIRYYEYPKKQH